VIGEFYTGQNGEDCDYEEFLLDITEDFLGLHLQGLGDEYSMNYTQNMRASQLQEYHGMSSELCYKF